jgi:hypothetical protein
MNSDLTPEELRSQLAKCLREADKFNLAMVGIFISQAMDKLSSEIFAESKSEDMTLGEAQSGKA